MRTVFFYIFLFWSQFLCANDGAFFASGNQLIPIQETDISVKKEILHIKKVNHKYFKISVYYEFYNPKDTKEIIVGFEAYSPQGDVDGTPKNGKHAYMRDFTVQINNNILPYEVAIVGDSLYNQSGNIQKLDLRTYKGDVGGNYVQFFYVYHFNSKFKFGINKITHTYTFDISGGVEYDYDLTYILTAANRCANKQIDDFTLILEMGEFEIVNVNK